MNKLYKQNIKEFECKTLLCCHGHELIYVPGKKVKSYFRHKNTEDVYGSNMTEWHSEWESNFPDRLVSSHKIISDSFRTFRALKVMSSILPIGVDTR